MLLVRILLGMLPVICFAAPPKFPGGLGRIELAELMNVDPGTCTPERVAALESIFDQTLRFTDGCLGDFNTVTRGTKDAAQNGWERRLARNAWVNTQRQRASGRMQSYRSLYRDVG